MSVGRSRLPSCPLKCLYRRAAPFAILRLAVNLSQKEKVSISMKRIFYSLVFSLLIVTLAVPSAFATCTQGAQCWGFGGCTSIQYLYNIDFSEGCAWSRTSTSAVTIVTSGGTEMSVFGSYAKLNYNGGSASQVWQDVDIPSTETRTHWIAGYNIKVTDPNFSSTNQLYVQVYDATAFSVLATSTIYYGNGTDPDGRMDTLTIPGTHNLAGHTIEVLVHAVATSSNTHFYVTGIQLDADTH
jgi:hypothetical protein